MASILGSRLKRYKGLVALISALITFIIIVVVLRTYLDTVIVQRETFARVKTLNFVEMLERFGTQDKQLIDDAYAHVLMYRDGGRLATLYGPAWDYPPVLTPSLIDASNKVIDAYLLSDWPAFESNYTAFDRTNGELTQGRQRMVLIAQYVAAGIMFFGFLGVLGLLFFRLGKADDEASEVRQENDHILASTKEGVFLIGSDYQIGEQRSRAVSDLFGHKREVGGDFLEFIKQFVTEEDLSRTKKFLNLVFGGRVKPKLMGDLNPLHNVELQVEKRVGGSIKRVLNFDFSRDDQSEVVNDLLVTVSDITSESLLREELETIQNVQQQRLDLLKGILHVEPNKLNDFFTTGREAYKQINSHFEEGNTDPDANFQNLDKIARITHRLKGDAASLRLDLFTSSLHQFEDTMDSLRKENLVDGQSLVKLVVQLKNMIAELDLASSLTNQFGMQALLAEPDVGDNRAGGILTPVQNNEFSVASNFTEKLNDLTLAVAERQGKSVNFSVNGAHHLEQHTEIADGIYDIAVQLVRNSVVHGIEGPVERAGHNKPEFGKLEVSLAKRSNDLILTVSDDGQGLPYDKIREKAIGLGLLDRATGEKADERLLLKTMFKHGFTSTDQVDQDAGRGVGLDAVKELLAELNGHISVGTAAGKYTRFVVTLATS